MLLLFATGCSNPSASLPREPRPSGQGTLVHSGDREQIYTTIEAVMEINGETIAEIPSWRGRRRLGVFLPHL